MQYVFFDITALGILVSDTLYIFFGGHATYFVVYVSNTIPLSPTLLAVSMFPGLLASLACGYPTRAFIQQTIAGLFFTDYSLLDAFRWPNEIYYDTIDCLCEAFDGTDWLVYNFELNIIQQYNQARIKEE